MLQHLDIKQAAICCAVLGVILLMGGHLAGHVLFGILMFAGLVALVENVPSIKKIVYMSNKFLDISIFVASVMATIYMGVTITGAITVASLIFSLIYAPMIRNQMRAAKEIKELKQKAKILDEVKYTQVRHKRKLK